MMSGPEPTVFIVDNDEAVRTTMAQLAQTVNLKTKTFASALAFLDAYDPADPGCLSMPAGHCEIPLSCLRLKLVILDD